MLYKKVRAAGKSGIVVEVRSGFARVIMEGEERWFPVEELEEISVLDRLIKGELDDPMDFVLAMDAYRLDTEYKFNPYVLASSTKIEIYPHQIDEVTLMLDRSRFLLADEVGLGKTIVAALVASELVARGLVKKMLFTVPKALVEKWIEELKNRFEMNAEFLDSNYLKINPNPFNREEFCYVASMDTLKQDHFLKLLEKAEFDFVVVDEAHKFSKDTERYELGKVLAPRTKYMYFLTATPHSGNDEDYIARMRLLDPYITDSGSTKHLVIRNLKDDVVNIDGREVFPPRESKSVEVKLSPKEIEVHEMLEYFIAKKLQTARLKGDRKEVNSVRFLGIILKKRASSSFHALRTSLENRIRRTVESTEDVEKLIKKLREAEEEFDEAERDKREQELLSRLILSEEVRELSEIIRKINALEKDSKLEKLLEMIERIKKSDPGAKIVIFTEYKDTMEYLAKILAKKYKVATIDGTMTLEERSEELRRFRDLRGAEVMVCTDAAGEGIDMQFCNIEINYDIPWNPTRLEQRMGRVHRIGQERKVYYYNFITRDTLDGYILSKLFDKMESIREALSDKVYDVIGKLVSEKDLNELFEELLNVSKERWEAKVKKLDDIVESRRKLLDKIEKLIAGHRLDRTKIEDIRKVGRKAIDEREVKRFVEVFVNYRGGRISRVEDEIYRIVLPRDIAHELGKGIIEGTFSRKVALRTTYPYLALGNKAVMAMVRAAMRDSVVVFRHPYLRGFVFFYRIFVVDGRGREKYGKFIGITEDGGIVDPKLVWDLDPVEEAKIPEPSLISEVAERIEKRALEEATKAMEYTSKKFEEIKGKTRSIVISYYSGEISKVKEKLDEYRKKVIEAPHYERLAKAMETRIKNLRKELDGKLKEIEEMYRLRPCYELVGAAYIIPYEDYDAKKAVELAGIEAVLKFERERARTEEERAKIKDVSNEFRGYDVESFDRVVEVKSFKTTGAIELTSNEWIVASRLGDYYWLYIVENALEDPKITTVQNPVEVFKDIVVKVPKVEYRYVIEDWRSVLGV